VESVGTLKSVWILLVVLGTAPAVAGQAPPARPLERTTAERPVPVRTDHLTVVAYPSARTVTAGRAFSLVFEVTPRQRMHVYAPGAEPYQIIRVSLEPNPQVSSRPTVYPPSELYLFEPLNERVPVYQKAFIMRQPVIVQAPTDGAKQVTIKGTLAYQACDDQVCFGPRTIPFQHTVQLR
jgi:hypothetical protein